MSIRAQLAMSGLDRTALMRYVTNATLRSGRQLESNDKITIITINLHNSNSQSVAVKCALCYIKRPFDKSCHLGYIKSARLLC